MTASQGKVATSWPADAVVRRKVAELIPYAGNARTHSEAQVGQIARSIERFGFTVPVLVDSTGGIIAGHGRVMAAKALGLAEVPVMIADGWTAEEKRAYVLADNKLALNAGWDEDILRAEIDALRAADFDLGFTGFEAVEIGELFARAVRALGDPEETPEPPAVPVSRLGDLWVCGDHRVLCGDATNEGDVLRLLAGAKPHLMVTDPPYGVDYDPEWRQQRGLSGVGAASGRVINDDRADWREAYEHFPGDVAYAWSADLRSKESIEGLVGAGFELRAQIIWAKNNIVIGRGHYHFQHEPCWYAVRKGGKANWSGDRSQTTLWMIDKPMKSETGHSTQKPVECMRRPIINNSKPGDAVYDPFLGSGTTMIAAEMESRKCYGLEIAPEYVDVIVRRWQQFTGQTATLEGDGRTFDAVAIERVPAAAAA